jgi:hypothetical protein
MVTMAECIECGATEDSKVIDTCDECVDTLFVGWRK